MAGIILFAFGVVKEKIVNTESEYILIDVRHLQRGGFLQWVNLIAPVVLLFAGSLRTPAQSPGFDLFQTGPGTSVTLPNIGVVALQGVAIQSSTCNTEPSFSAPKECLLAAAR